MVTRSALCSLLGTARPLVLPLALALHSLGAPNQPIRLHVDLRDAPRKFLHAQLSIPAHAGPLDLVYPKWIPGEHSPTGPIDNFAGLEFRAKGQVIPWHRDDVDMFKFHLTVPAGATEVQAKVDFLATAPPSGFSAGASTSPNLALLSWNELLLYPAGSSAEQVMVAPDVTLPNDWQLGTALTRQSTREDVVTFAPVTLATLVDSPVLAGKFFKEVPLAPEVEPKHFLDMAGDGPEDLRLTEEQINSFSNLVRETGALYKSRHYTSYHFLLTLSDSVAHFGLEHHQSSDDRVDARTFLDEDLALLSGDLLPHEFTHSWNGKYRRPEGLVTANYQQPMKGDLLWVYEGLTQYLGDVLAVRSGIWTADQYRAYLADSAAMLDHRPGRTWRDLQDTATAAQILYQSNDHWDNWRRSVDYYAEGELVWLDADTTIRRLSHNRRSLNDFCAKFLGFGGNTGPELVPYTFDDLVAALNSVEHFDWGSFFRERLESKSPRAPLGGIEGGGYRVEYTDTPNEYSRAYETRERGLNAWYSLGFMVEDGALADVLVGSPAYQSGLGPGMHLVAVNGRRYADDLLRQAIRDAKSSNAPVDLIAENAGYYKVVHISYRDGEKYPHLVRDDSKPALMDDILKSLVPGTRRASLR